MKSVFSKVVMAAALVTAVMGAIAPAQATVVAYDFKATSKVARPDFGLAIGDLISGTVKYDTEGAYKTSGNSSNGNGYQYWDAPVFETTINFGTYHGTFDTYGMVVNNFQMWGGDEMFFRSEAAPFGRFEIALIDNSERALTSLELPTSFDITKFNRLTFTARNGDVATITSFTAASKVPEPASLALFGLGLAGIAAVRRRKV